MHIYRIIIGSPPFSQSRGQSLLLWSVWLPQCRHRVSERRSGERRLSERQLLQISSHTYIHPSIPTYLHTYIPTYIHTYIPTYLHTYIPTYIHTYIPTYLHTYIPTYIHTYIHTYLHTYIHNFYSHSLLVPLTIVPLGHRPAALLGRRCLMAAPAMTAATSVTTECAMVCM